ncbi:MAG: MBL fold metallo-hydrolase [Candidatus Thorarchaeota archaeon]|nr:MBL fold metallo-hydrolase [Candidatus Thorarchaeota archaeon]
MIEVEQFRDDIVCVKTATESNGQPIMWVYSYLIGKVLFDAGCANAASEFASVVGKHPPEMLLVSHSHEDHVGACSQLEHNTPVYARPAVIPILRAPPVIGEFFSYVWGQPGPVEDVRVIPTSVESGDYYLELVELPGHGRDMVGFYEPRKRWLFSADAVPLPSKKQIAIDDENVPRMISTMEKIQQMDIAVLFDSHRGPIQSPREHIQKRIDYLKGIAERARVLHEEGVSIDDIVKALEFEAPWYMDLTGRRFGMDYLIRSLLFDKP